MKSRHAAALALVGWYLVLVPANDKSWGSKPRNTVVVWDIYSDKSSCERDRPGVAKGLSDEYATYYPNSGYAVTVSCVATNAPSLKGKSFVQRVK
jgi:hypothetical protein